MLELLTTVGETLTITRGVITARRLTEGLKSANVLPKGYLITATGREPLYHVHGVLAAFVWLVAHAECSETVQAEYVRVIGTGGLLPVAPLAPLSVAEISAFQVKAFDDRIKD